MKDKKLLSHEEQEKYILDRIGDPVHFKYPIGEGERKGELIDRVAYFQAEDDRVAYWGVIDCIRFEAGLGTGLTSRYTDVDWVRISYYRYRKNTRSWNFAGQTSITLPKDIWKGLLKAGKEKDWFKPILEL